MEAGRLNHRITIQRPVKDRAKSGQQISQWEDYLTLWAEVNCTDSKAVGDDGIIQHEGLYRFYIRYAPGISADMRVIWQGRTFLMVGPPADWKGDQIGLTLITRELV